MYPKMTGKSSTGISLKNKPSCKVIKTKAPKPGPHKAKYFRTCAGIASMRQVQINPKQHIITKKTTSESFTINEKQIVNPKVLPIKYLK